MKNFYILVGNIGAGKTTYIKNNIQAPIIISKDSIRYAIGGGEYIFNRFYEPVIHDITMKMTDNFCAIAVADIVLDETNMSKKNRKQFIKVAQKYGYDVIGLVMPELSKEEAVNRRMTNPHCQTDRTLWESVWERFHKAYVKPTKAEGFTKVVELKKEDIGAVI